jgi:hypothetical protein
VFENRLLVCLRNPPNIPVTLISRPMLSNPLTKEASPRTANRPRNQGFRLCYWEVEWIVCSSNRHKPHRALPIQPTIKRTMISAYAEHQFHRHLISALGFRTVLGTHRAVALCRGVYRQFREYHTVLHMPGFPIIQPYLHEGLWIYVRDTVSNCPVFDHLSIWLMHQERTNIPPYGLQIITCGFL